MSSARCDVVPIFPSPRALAVFTIDDRAYTVYSTGVYLGQSEVASFASRVVDAALCGTALALFLSDSTLAVLSARMLADPRLWGVADEIAEERTGVSHFHEMLPSNAQVISADCAGSLICVHLGFSTVAIYEYAAATHTLRSLKSTIIEHDFQKFQIVSVGSMPYLWTARSNSRSHSIELHEIASLALKHTAGRELCSLPLKTPHTATRTGHDPDRAPRHTAPRVELLPAGERDGGLLVHAGHCLFYIPLSSAIAGDTGPTMRPVLDYAEHIFYTQTSATSRTFYVCDSSRNVFELLIDFLQKRVTRSDRRIAEAPAPAYLFQKTFLALPRNSPVLAIERSTVHISQCELDTRKWPWRTLVLSEYHLTALASVTAVDYMERVGLNCLDSALMLAEVPRLKTLFVSTPAGTGWLSQREMRFDGLQNRPLLAVGEMASCLVFVSASGLELRNILPPYAVRASWSADPRELVLDASIGLAHCLLRLPERAVAVRIGSTGDSLDVVEVLAGVSISFVRCEKEKSFIGVATITEADVHNLRRKYENYAVAEVRTSISGSSVGHTLCFGHELTRPVAIYSHDYLPTDLVALEGGTLAVLHSADGRVSLILGRGRAPTIHNVLSTVNVAGRLGTSKQVAILFGRGGLWAVTAGGCRMIYHRRSRMLGDTIQRACVMDDGNVALITKGELCVLQSPLSYGNQLPSQLQSVSSVGEDTRMLLIPSNRIVVVYGENQCTFLDSTTLKRLHVHGLRVRNCEVASLWQFQLDGETYEHLVFSNGKAVIESYAISRHENEVNLERKLRFIVAYLDRGPLAFMNRFRMPEVLCCHKQFVYLGRADQVFKVCPVKNRRLGNLYVDTNVRGLSRVDDYLIVSTQKSIHVVDAAAFKMRATAPVDKDVTGHVAGFVNVDGHRVLHILCSRARGRFAILAFDEGSDTLSLQVPGHGGLSDRDHCVRSLSSVPSDAIRDGFSAVAVMADYSVKQITVASPALAERAAVEII